MGHGKKKKCQDGGCNGVIKAPPFFKMCVVYKSRQNSAILTFFLLNSVDTSALQSSAGFRKTLGEIATICPLNSVSFTSVAFLLCGSMLPKPLEFLSCTLNRLSLAEIQLWCQIHNTKRNMPWFLSVASASHLWLYIQSAFL